MKNLNINDLGYLVKNWGFVIPWNEKVSFEKFGELVLSVSENYRAKLEGEYLTGFVGTIEHNYKGWNWSISSRKELT